MVPSPAREYLPYEIQSRIDGWPDPVFSFFEWHRDNGGEKGRAKVVTFSPSKDLCTVLIPGLNGRWQTWSPLLRAMVEENKDFGPMIILDFTGSHFPSSTKELCQISKCLASYLIANDYINVRLIGHSTGGCMASYMASKFESPELEISHLYLICGVFVNLFRAAHVPTLMAWSKGDTARTLAKLRLLSAGGPAAVTYLRLISRNEFLSRRALGRFFAAPEDAPIDVIRETLKSFDVRTVRETLAIGKAYDYVTVYKSIAVPTTAIIGKRDPLVTSADAQFASKMISGLVCSVIEGAGHFPHIERPNETLHALELDGLGKA